MDGDLAYLALKYLHIVASVVLLGNFLALVAWKVAADRSRDVAAMAFTMDRIHRFDGLVTAVSGLLVFAFGYVGVRGFGTRIANAPFALWGLILMTVAGLIWYFGMRPLEVRMADLSEEALARGQNAPREYYRASGLWFLCVGLVVALVLVIAALMVFKPDVWPYVD